MFLRGRPITMYVPSGLGPYGGLRAELPPERLQLDWVYPAPRGGGLPPMACPIHMPPPTWGSLSPSLSLFGCACPSLGVPIPLWGPHLVVPIPIHLWGSPSIFGGPIPDPISIHLWGSPSFSGVPTWGSPFGGGGGSPATTPVASLNGAQLRVSGPGQPLQPARAGLGRAGVLHRLRRHPPARPAPPPAPLPAPQRLRALVSPGWGGDVPCLHSTTPPLPPASPRSLAVHPDRLRVATGQAAGVDKDGKVMAWDGMGMGSGMGSEWGWEQDGDRDGTRMRLGLRRGWNEDGDGTDMVIGRGWGWDGDGDGMRMGMG